MNRRSLLLMPLAAIPVGAYARFVEPEWLEVTNDRIVLPGMQPGRRIRVVQLSDLHASDVVPKELIEHAIDLAIAQKPDLLCLTGDYITVSRGVDRAWYSKVLSRIPDRVRCFASLGNHDGGWATRFDDTQYSTEGVKKLLASAGLPLLANQSAEFTIGSQTLRVVGLEDLWAHTCNPRTAFREISDASVPTIVLAHNPDTKDIIPNYPWHLMLSGHTHGGQVVMPVLGLCMAPVQDRRYIRGLKPWKDRFIHVSAGVGNINGVRFNCRPQVNVLDLVA